MWCDYYSVANIDQALNLLAEYGSRGRVIAGGTDLLLEIERGARPDIDVLIDISRIPDLDQVILDEEEFIHLGALVTHSHCMTSRLVVEKAFPLAMAASQVGAPQIRNRGTVAGNLITASPANDTITPLMALGAKVLLRSRSGERLVPLESFFTGVRQTVLCPDELLVEIIFPAMKSSQRGTFAKLGLRQAQAIAVINVAVNLSFRESPAGLFPSRHALVNQLVESAILTLGAVAPTIIHAREAEEFLQGKVLTPEIIDQAARLAAKAAQPIDDIRGSKEYRREMVRVYTRSCLEALSTGEEKIGYPDQPVLLWGRDFRSFRSVLNQPIHHKNNTPIVTCINNKSYTFFNVHNKTLLRLLREEAGLMGTKEGCAEGECGACTVFMDGKAVMACLVPAARAHATEIITIEGLGQNGNLHPVQQAFIEKGAVQCGYCTPGFIMSAAKLLEEIPHPTIQEIKQSLTGNLCRCTGYYKIVQAIERASQAGG